MGGAAPGSKPLEDREDRNRRIAVGVVEVAVLAAVVWVVATGGVTDRPPKPPAPTGPPVPMPSMEPSVSPVPTLMSQYPPSSERVGGVPPEGAVPSTPESGTLVAHYAERYWGWAYVYADGRVVWYPVAGSTWELRLTPYGVDLVRFGAVEPSEFLDPFFSPPVNAWADPEIRLYVPSRYAICYSGDRGQLEASRIVDLLPEPAKGLLRGKERTYDVVAGLTEEQRGPSDPPECSEVTAEEARALDEILSDAGLGRSGSSYHLVPPERAMDSVGERISISFRAILPHGTWVAWGA